MAGRGKRYIGNRGTPDPVGPSRDDPAGVPLKLLSASSKPLRPAAEQLFRTDHPKADLGARDTHRTISTSAPAAPPTRRGESVA